MVGRRTTVVDSRGFRDMCKALAGMSGKSMPEIIDNRVGKVLETCVRYTPARSKDKLVRGMTNRIQRKYNTYARGNAGSVDEYIGSQSFTSAAKESPRISITSGGAWWVEEGEKRKFYKMSKGGQWGDRSAPGGARWNASRWAAYQQQEQERKADLAEGMNTAITDVKYARGLSKSSWYRIAAELGIEISVPEYVRVARPSNRKSYSNARAERFKTPDTYFVEIENRMPVVVQNLDGFDILQRAIRANIRAFNMDVQKGWILDKKRQAERYRGILIT